TTAPGAHSVITGGTVGAALRLGRARAGAIGPGTEGSATVGAGAGAVTRKRLPQREQRTSFPRSRAGAAATRPQLGQVRRRVGSVTRGPASARHGKRWPRNSAGRGRRPRRGPPPWPPPRAPAGHARGWESPGPTG